MSEQSEYNLRVYTPSDVVAVAQVINAATGNLFRGAVVDNAGNLRLIRYVPITAKRVVISDSQDKILAFAYLTDREESIVYEMGGAVHPDYQGKGLGTMLLEWAEKNARLLSKKAPVSVKTILQANIYATESNTIKVLTGNGYNKVREWMHLVIELDTAPMIPATPDGLSFREMNLEEDWEIVASAMDEAYADHWGAILLSEDDIPDTVEEEESDEKLDVAVDDSYSNAPGHCFLLMDDAIVAGGILCNNKLVEREDSGRVGSLFVRPKYRRQGVGRALMLKAFHSFWQAGFRRIVCDTDAESFSESPVFYANLGMHEYKRESLYEKTIVDGKEVRRLNR